MDSEALKILFIGKDDQFARDVDSVLRETGEMLERADLEHAASAVKANSFSAILFEPPTANAAGLFQITSLTTQIPNLAVIIVGSIQDEGFAIETSNAGAQGFLARETLNPTWCGAPSVARWSGRLSVWRWWRKRKIITASLTI